MMESGATGRQPDKITRTSTKGRNKGDGTRARRGNGKAE